MSDERLRRLERRHAQGDPEAGLLLYRELLRTGRLTQEDLRDKAHARDPLALELLGFADLLTRLEAWTAIHRPLLFGSLNEGLDAEGQATVEGALGHPFPGLVAELYRWRNGQRAVDGVGGFYGEWYLLPADQLEDSRRMLYHGLRAEDVPSTGGLLPLMRHDYMFSFLCLDLDGTTSGRVGQVVRQDADYYEEETGVPEHYDLLFPSLDQWLRTYVESLEEGLWEPAEDEDDEPNDGLRPIDSAVFEAFVERQDPGYPRTLDEVETDPLLRTARIAAAIGSALLLLAVFTLEPATFEGWLLFGIEAAIAAIFFWRTAHDLRLARKLRRRELAAKDL